VNATSIGEQLRRLARGTLPKSVYVRGAGFLDSWHGMQKFGVDGYRRLSEIRRSPQSSTPRAVQLRPLEHPFYVRPGTPDADVVIHAMARETYGYMLPRGPVHFIVDAGANIGDTSVWYATRYPDASIVAIEPNDETLRVLRQNCAPYGERIHVLGAALWPVAGKQMETAGTFTGIYVSESSRPGALSCPSIDPLTILRDAGRDVIDIFKIDIEGAERDLFSGPCDAWLSKTRNIAIEIHSREAMEAVTAATERNGFKRARYRDLYVFWK
jgi:FkbM family methyltransferase